MKQMRFFSLIMTLVLLLCPLGQAEQTMDPAIERMGIELPGGSVFYPQLSGLEDAALQESINHRLRETGNVETLLNRLALLMQSPVKLTADYTAFLHGGVLSCAMTAAGPVSTDRVTQVWSAVNIDLITGEDITFADLFLDPDAAHLALEEYLDWEVAPEMSAHLANSDLLPLPETFSITSTGLTLHYPLESLSTLSGRAGTITILWSELREHLRLGEGSILRRIGAEAMVTPEQGNADAIRQAVERGSLPGIPAEIGGSIAQAVDAYALLIDPDLYESGRLFQLEDGAFRQVYLMTDRLTETWDSSVIQGIRADRLNFFGLCTGQTERQVWLDMLGAPDATVLLDADRADANRMEPGTSDYYRFGDHQLRLHANENGILTSVLITY